MARVALVTGGSRGIGEAISKKLQADGYTVAATYAGNDEAAAKFTAETGIKTYKWNVGDYESSAAGIANSPMGRFARGLAMRSVPKNSSAPTRNWCGTMVQRIGLTRCWHCTSPAVLWCCSLRPAVA